MKIKILGILVCTLFIATSLPTLGKMNDNNAFRQIFTKNSDLVKLTEGNIMSDWFELGKLIASDLNDFDRFGASVSINGDYAIIGASADDNEKGEDAGSAYIFKRTGTTWTEEQKLIASNGIPDEHFGISVCLKGDYAIIGAPYWDEYKGRAFIFKRTGTTWIEEQELKPEEHLYNEIFGKSVCTDGKYAYIGAPNAGQGTGAVYVFKRTGSTWSQEHILTASDGEEGDYFGTSVSCTVLVQDGKYVIVGAPDEDNDNIWLSGSAYVFKHSDTTWIEEQKLTASDAAFHDHFGYSVSINAYHAIIGAYGDDNNWEDAGSAYIFKRTGTTWTEEQKLIGSMGGPNGYQGNSVCINGNYAIIGAPGCYLDRGASFIFKRDGNLWTQAPSLLASDMEKGDSFGNSVSIDGWSYNCIIGSPGDDNEKGEGAGSAYVFKSEEPDIGCDGTLKWIDIKPGEKVIGEFTVENIGFPETKLNWTIDTYPTWGSWSFEPLSGTGLTPEMGSITVDVEVVAPNQKNQHFDGEVKVVDTDKPSDYDTISVSLTTPRDKVINSPFFYFPRHYPYLFTLQIILSQRLG